VDRVDYLQQRVLPKICNNNQIKWSESWIGQTQWSNNNCESVNHLLKMQVGRMARFHTFDKMKV